MMKNEILEEKIRNTVEDLSKSILKENYDENTFIEQLKSIDTFKGRYRFCIENLGITAGRGSSRVVFYLNDDWVLKLALNQKGIAQNEAECDYYGQQIGMTAKVKDADYKNYTFIVSEYALPAKANDFKEVTGVDWYTVQLFIKASFYNHRGTRSQAFLGNRLNYEDYAKLLDDENGDENVDTEFFQRLDEYIGDTDILWGDLTRLSSWGLVSREYGPDLILIDSGFNEATKKFYK